MMFPERSFKWPFSHRPAHQALFILLETPRGRANVVCVAKRQTFDARKPEFEAVARGLTVPQ